MATKTISIEIDVYDRLVERKRHSRESFSQVLRRAKWEDESLTASDLLELVDIRRESGFLLTERKLDLLDHLQEMDTAPEDKWGSS